MNDYRLEESNNSFCLRIFNNQQVGCSLIFIGGVGLFMFLMPITVMIFIIKELSFGTSMSCLLSWLISVYFFRLYLWNKYGQEVFIMKERSLIKFNDYYYFKDNEKEISYSQIEIYYVYKNEAYLIDEFENIRSDVDVNEYSVIIFKLDDEEIISHKRINIIEIIQIAKQVHLYFHSHNY